MTTAKKKDVVYYTVALPKVVNSTREFTHRIFEMEGKEVDSCFNINVEASAPSRLVTNPRITVSRLDFPFLIFNWNETVIFFTRKEEAEKECIEQQKKMKDALEASIMRAQGNFAQQIKDKRDDFKKTLIGKVIYTVKATVKRSKTDYLQLTSWKVVSLKVNRKNIETFNIPMNNVPKEPSKIQVKNKQGWHTYFFTEEAALNDFLDDIETKIEDLYSDTESASKRIKEEQVRYNNLNTVLLSETAAKRGVEKRLKEINEAKKQDKKTVKLEKAD